MALVVARSASRQVQEWLSEGQIAGRVLSVHDRVCNLSTGEGRVIALVASEVGDGPLNIVLEDRFDSLRSACAGMQVVCEPDRLRLGAGEIRVSLESVKPWEPCPDWDGLYERWATIERRLADLTTICLNHEPSSVLLHLLGVPLSEHGYAAIVAERVRDAVLQIRAGWEGDEVALAQGGAALAGLGDGLTPAGDDFMAGVMLWAWLAHSTPRRFCRVLAEAAVPRTTTLSAAFLQAAARGQCSVAWHRLLEALAQGKAGACRLGGHLACVAQEVLAHGASSGLDALIGFLVLSRG